MTGAPLQAHGLADLAAAVASAHQVEGVGASPAAVDELVDRLRARGWSRRNVERLVGVAVEPVVVWRPRLVSGRGGSPAPLPRTEPVHLVVVAVDAIERPTDHFWCEPYGATLSVAACLRRQGAEQAPRRVRWQHSGGSRTRFERCAECALGRQVAAAVGAVAEPVA